jgi:hypothetical protein
MKSIPWAGPPPASTRTCSGKPIAGITSLRSLRAKSCAAGSPYSCLPAMLT